LYKKFGQQTKFVLHKRTDKSNRTTLPTVFSTLGYMVHPRILTALPPSPIIADVGTGTGILLLELAKTYPSTVEFLGIDSSDRLLPQGMTYLRTSPST
jgi:tRNA G46 methylase TrmB